MVLDCFALRARNDGDKEHKLSKSDVQRRNKAKDQISLAEYFALVQGEQALRKRSVHKVHELSKSDVQRRNKAKDEG